MVATLERTSAGANPSLVIYSRRLYSVAERRITSQEGSPGNVDEHGTVGGPKGFSVRKIAASGHFQSVGNKEGVDVGPVPIPVLGSRWIS